MHPAEAEANLTRLRRCLMLAAMPMVFISFGLPIRATAMGASGLEVGMLFSVFTAAVLLVRPVAGVGLDRWGRRGFLLFALSMYALANTTFALADSFVTLFVARALQGTAMATLLITADTITADLCATQQRSAAMGGNMQSSARGGMLGATIGFSLVGFVPAIAWNLSFAIFAAVAFVALFTARAVTESAAGAAASVAPHGQQGTSFTPPPALLRLAAVVALAGFAAALIQPLYLIYLQAQFDLELRVLAAVFLPVGLAYALLPARIGRRTATLPRRHAMAAGLLASGLCYALIPTGMWLLAMLCLFVLAALGSILADLTRNAWVADLAPAGATGRTFATMELAAGLGAVVGPLVGGLLYDRAGGHTIFWVGGALLMLAAVLVNGWVARQRS